MPGKLSRRELIRGRQKQAWLRRHGAAEASLAKAVVAWLAAIGDEAIGRLEQGQSTDALQLIDLPAASDSLRAAVEQPLLRLAVAGVMDELSSLEPKAKQAGAIEPDDDDLGGSIIMDVPENVLAAVRNELGTILEQPYWSEIPETIAIRLQNRLTAAIETGGGLEEMISAVQAVLGSAANARRAAAIARTETTGALNAGHHAARAELIELGLITGLEWVTIPDTSRRETHAALEGTIVGANDTFTVGGFEAPYPGHYSLPARERVNCRCFTVTATTFADED